MTSAPDPHAPNRATTTRLTSTVSPDPAGEGGVLRLAVETTPIPEPHDDQVLIRVDAAPINPSDLGLVLAGADLSAATSDGTPDEPVVTAPVPPAVFAALSGRVGRAMPVGNEGAGVVVAAGAADEARALLGATVAVLGGGMYAGYRSVPANQCLRLPDGVSAVEGASCFVNPLTALGMVGTMKLEHHHALVHTAAASNLGQMLNRLCLADGIALVNIVRRDEHVELLRSQGATHVLNSTSPDFDEELTDALAATGATLAFDAIGGGDLGGRILAGMERAAVRSSGGYDRYGSSVHKQVYVYGGLDRGPTVINRSFGMAWSIGGWLLMPFLARVGEAEAQRLRERVAAEITTTFASAYTDEVSLTELLDLDTLRDCARQATGRKYLVRPHTDA